MTVNALWFVLGLGAQCSDNGLNTLDDPNTEGAEQDIVLWPQDMDFGQHRKGEGQTETFEVRNQGTLPLTISDVSVQGGASYELITQSFPSVLEPGEAFEVEVAFTAWQVENDGRLIVTSDDPDTPTALAPLYGEGLIPALAVTPDPFDFGIVEPLCETSVTISLSNIGLDTLVIDSLIEQGEGFALEDVSGRLPMSIEPGAWEDVEVTFTPPDYGEFTGELWVDSNAQDPVAIQIGEGGDGSVYEEEWEQPIAGRSDVLFWIDKSCSMEDDAERLISNFDAFIEDLEELENDYLIGVTIADKGCISGEMIEPDTANKTAVFRNAITAAGGGLYTEAGLTVAGNAVRETVGGCNSAFLRDNTQLSVVMISDEPEQSPYAIGTNTLISNILQIAPSTYLNAVAGPVPDACETADPGIGYMEAAVATGGLFLDICDETWGPKLTQLAERSNTVQLADTFYLKYQNIQANTVTVYVNEVEVEEGWTLDEDANAVVFDEDSIPPEGATVRITYSTATTCDA